MAKLIENFPVLTRELVQSLRTAGHEAVADQLEAAVIRAVTFDDDANAGTISVEPSRDLNVVEANVIGVKHGGTITVESRFWTAIDMDNFGRVLGIEILDPGVLTAELKRRASG